MLSKPCHFFLQTTYFKDNKKLPPFHDKPLYFYIKKNLRNLSQNYLMLYDNKKWISFPVRPHQVLRQHRRRHQPHQVRPLHQGNEHTFSALRNLKPSNRLDVLHVSPTWMLYKIEKKSAFTKDPSLFKPIQNIFESSQDPSIHRCSYFNND